MHKTTTDGFGTKRHSNQLPEVHPRIRSQMNTQ